MTSLDGVQLSPPIEMPVPIKTRNQFLPLLLVTVSLADVPVVWVTRRGRVCAHVGRASTNSIERSTDALIIFFIIFKVSSGRRFGFRSTRAKP
jgi:hypothetical protein